VVRRKSRLILFLEKSSPRIYDSGGGYIGSCTGLVWFAGGKSFGVPRKKGWFLTKYSDEQTTDLNWMSEEELVELAFQFGLTFGYGDEDRIKRFFESPAFACVSAGIRSMKISPIKLGRAEHNYLGDWFAHAKSSVRARS
jgi:hypothetical protein